MRTASDPATLESIEARWILLKRLESHPKQGAIATASGLDESTLSAWKNNKGAMKIGNLRLLLRALNLKLVDADSKCVREETFRELTQLAARALRETPQLLWEEE